MITICITDIKCTSKIGINEFERHIKTNLLVNLSFDINFDEKTADSIDNTVDYDLLSKDIQRWSSEQSFFLLEKFSTSLKKYLIENYNISNLKMSVTKLRAVDNEISVKVSI